LRTAQPRTVDAKRGSVLAPNTKKKKKKGTKKERRSLTGILSRTHGLSEIKKKAERENKGGVHPRQREKFRNKEKRLAIHPSSSSYSPGKVVCGRGRRRKGKKRAGFLERRNDHERKKKKRREGLHLVDIFERKGPKEKKKEGKERPESPFLF